jgi:hypothetical protein
LPRCLAISASGPAFRVIGSDGPNGRWRRSRPRPTNSYVSIFTPKYFFHDYDPNAIFYRFHYKKWSARRVAAQYVGHYELNAADKVIVLDSAGAQLTLIDEATHKVVGTEPTGKEPHHLMRRSHISAKRKSIIGLGDEV